MDKIKGKHFSITDPQGVNTVIYRIYKTDKKLLNEYPKYTVQRLVYAEELNGNLKKKTFFVDGPQPEEELVILSFGKDKVVVNMGLLADDKVKIAKRPIIDPETTEEVKPILYFDQETNEVKGKCKLKPYKSYFAFEIRDKKQDV